MIVCGGDPAAADLVFHALAHAIRRDILARTLGGEHSVSSLAGHYSMSFAAVQKHVAVLEEARLVSKRREGRERLVTANVETIRATVRLLDELEAAWRRRIDRFGAALAEPDESRPR
jgi:DNA-binding transcriptional ArsR family regulator